MNQTKILTYGVIAILLTTLLLGLAYTQIKAGSAPPTVKIGLVAPFEGHYRSTGYEVLFAVKLALQERNRGEGLVGYRVELVALNDFNEPSEAYRQAQSLAADPGILGVIGHFSSEATEAALPIYQEAHLAVAVPWSVDGSILKDDTKGVVSVAATKDEALEQLQGVGRKMGFDQLEFISEANIESISDDVQAVQLSTDAVTAGNIMLALHESNISVPVFGQTDVGNRQLIQVAGAPANGLIFVSPGPAATDVQADQDFIEAYQALAGFPPPPRAVQAYDATHVLLDSIEQAIMLNDKWFNQPDRSEVSEIITTIQHDGLTGEIIFDTHGQRLNAPIWIYQISNSTYPGKLVAP